MNIYIVIIGILALVLLRCFDVINIQRKIIKYKDLIANNNESIIENLKKQIEILNKK